MKFDKPVVFPEDVAGALASYGLFDVRDVRALGGVPNVTFVATCAGERYAIRFCNNGYTSPAHLDCEVRLLAHLGAAEFPLAPRLVVGASGGEIERWGDYRTIAMRFIDGISGDQVPVSRRLCHDVGGAVACLQSVVANFDPALPSSETFRARTFRLIERLPTTAADLGWSIDPARIAEQWAEAIVELEAVSGPAGLIHTDIWPPNVICRDGRLAAIVDFDDLAVGLCVIDLAAALAEFAIGDENRLNETNAFSLMSGYLAAGGRLNPSELGGLVPAIAASSAAWLACNALHQVSFAESQVYAERLSWLRGADGRATLRATLDSIYREASQIG